MADKAPRMNTTNLPRHETRCNGGSVSLVSRYAVIKNVRHNKRKRITVSAFDQRSQIPGHRAKKDRLGHGDDQLGRGSPYSAGVAHPESICGVLMVSVRWSISFSLVMMPGRICIRSMSTGACP